MKKFWKSLMFALVGVFALSSCEDVPAPYPIPNAEGGEKPATSTFYSSVSLSDWEMLAAESGNNPWSQGSSYTQATGYQKWDGADTKSNRMADGYIISPAFSTTTDSTTAYVSFQYCVAYANNDPQFADHIKMYVTSQYEAAEGFVADKWTELDWKATHVSTNWELETTAVALPAEFLNQEKVNVAFYFTTPNGDKSSTFELKDLKVVAGTPSENGGDTPTPSGEEVTCAQAAELTNALADGATSTEVYTVTGYITEVVGNVNNNQQTFWMADTQDGGRVFEAYWANLPEGVSQFTKGSKVKITGKLTKYVKDGKVTAEIKNADVEILEQGGDTPTPSGKEVTCAQAAELTNALEDGATSTEVYTVTGYITEVIGSVSRNQQTFWMADTKDGGRVFEAYYANLPEGVTAFTAGMKVKITGNLTKYVKDGKVTAEIKNANVEILEQGGDTPAPSGEEVTCAQAAELTNALEDGATSTEVYTVTGYITEVIGSVSRNQQTFWMADTKDGGRVFEAYYANLPEGVSAFAAGMKVKITGNLMKYVKDGKVTPEIKNADVVILEGGSDTPDTPDVSGNSITFVDMGYANAQDFNGQTITVGDATLAWSKGSGGTTPKYYSTGTGIRLYGGNTLTISSNKTIAKVQFTFDKGEDQNNRPLYATSGNTSFSPGTYDYEAQTWSGSAKEIVLTYTATGGHVRIQSIAITYAE